MDSLFNDVLENWEASCSQVVYNVLTFGHHLGLDVIPRKDEEDIDEWYNEALDNNIMALIGLLMNMRCFNNSSKFLKEDIKILSENIINTNNFLKNNLVNSISKKLFETSSYFNDYNENENIEELFFKHFKVAFPIVLFIMNNEILTRLVLLDRVVDDNFFNSIMIYLKINE
jgi:hypothetical protein